MVRKRLGRAVRALTLWTQENMKKSELRPSHFRLNSSLFIHMHTLFPVS